MAIVSYAATLKYEVKASLTLECAVLVSLQPQKNEAKAS